MLVSFFAPLRESKGRPERSEGKKVSGGHFFSPWEIPSFSERNPEDCEQKMIKRLPHAFGKSDTILIIDSRTGHPNQNPGHFSNHMRTARDY